MEQDEVSQCNNEVEQLTHLISSIGSVLLYAATITAQFPNKEEHILTSMSNDIIVRDLTAIRERIRSFYDSHKNYYSLNYMNFHIFERSLFVSLLNSKSSHTAKLTSLHNDPYYFMDTVKNVMSMAQWMRDGVRTLFVGENYDIKINMVKNMVKPDTLVVNTSGIKDVELPFMEHVRIIAIKNKSKIHIPLSNYLDTLTQLSITSYTLDEYTLELIATIKNLESIRLVVDILGEGDCEKVRRALELRRTYGYSNIVSFVMKHTVESFEDIVPLLHELHHHSLKSLNIMMLEGDSSSSIDAITAISKLTELKTLSIDCYNLQPNQIMEILDYRLTKLISLSIRCMEHQYSGEEEEDEEHDQEEEDEEHDVLKVSVDAILSMPNLKYLHFSEVGDISTVQKHTSNVRMRDKKLFVSQPSTEIVPIIDMNEHNTRVLQFITDDISWERSKQIDTIYKCDISDDISCSNTYTIDLRRRQKILAEIGESDGNVKLVPTIKRTMRRRK